MQPKPMVVRKPFSILDAEALSWDLRLNSPVDTSFAFPARGDGGANVGAPMRSEDCAQETFLRHFVEVPGNQPARVV